MLQDRAQASTNKCQKLYCLKCGNSQRSYVELDCGHVFCTLCAAFIYIKGRISVEEENCIKCIKCHSISQLHPEFIKLIHQTLKLQVLPTLDSNEPITSKEGKDNSREKPHQVETVERKIKSEEHSFDHVTPSTKYFFSKCESPSSRKNKSYQKCCRHHPTDPVVYLCMTCQAELLCVKCVAGGKKHTNHEIKDVKRGIQIIREQLGLSKLQIGYRVGQMEMWQRRIDDRVILVKHKSVKALKDIQKSFHQLRCLLKEKQEEIVANCKNHFESLLKNLSSEDEKLHLCIDVLKAQLDKISRLSEEKESFEYIDQFKKFKKSNQSWFDHSPLISFQKLACPSSSIYRSIAQLSEKIESLHIEYKPNSLDRIGTTVENCKSEQKQKKQKSYKRVRTNFGSLNSSRDNKKQSKKYTKTEEDQKKLKPQKMHNCKMDRRGSGKIPAYINEYINMKSSKCGSGGSSYALEMTSPNIHAEHSKITSKMSKTILPGQYHRKKEHIAAIKERLERKTVHPNFKSQKAGDSNKKKKNH